MRLLQGLRGISKLMLIILLLLAFIFGATLSYIWTMGYYASPEFQLPKKADLTIEDVAFSAQDTTFFNVTLLNPSYSPSSAEIRQIVAWTDDDIHTVKVSPSLPFMLKTGSSQTFRGIWNWANYTGQTITFVVSVSEGSGPNTEVKTPYVGLNAEAYFNSSISIQHFNATVENAATSATYVNITELTINGETIPSENITVNDEFVSFPYFINSSESVLFTCAWNWTKYQGENVTIAVYTSQGYWAQYAPPTLPQPVVLEITDILFDPSDTSIFNVTIQNMESSPSFVSINKMSVTMENETTIEILDTSPSLTPPFVLNPNTTETFTLFWNWSNYRNQTVTVTAHTSQGFIVQSASMLTPPPIILEIISIIFGPANTTFNMTLLNSGFSIKSANITRITVTFENGTVVEIVTVDPQLPKVVSEGESVVFTCTFEWFKYPGINVTVTAYTEEGFKATELAEVPTG